LSTLWRLLSEVYVTVKGLLRYRETAFWIIVFPILWYGLMVAIWGNPQPPTIEVAVYNGDPVEGESMLGDSLIKTLESIDYVRVENYSSQGDVYEAVKTGRVPIGIVVPENFSDTLPERVPPSITVYYMREEWGGFAYATIRGVLEAFADNMRGFAVNLSINYIETYTGNSSYASIAIRWLEFIREPLRVEEHSIVPPLLATPEGLRAYYALSMVGVESLFIGLFAGAMILAERKRTGTLAVLLSSPMRDWEILASDTISALVGVGISAAAVGLVSLASGARYEVEPLALLVAVVLMIVGTLFTIGLGLLLAMVAKTQEGATIIVNAIAFPVMFAGGIVIPVEVLPDYMKAFAHIWPLSRSLEEARRVLLGMTTPGEAVASAAPAIAAAIVVYVLGALVYKRMMSRIVEYY